MILGDEHALLPSSLTPPGIDYVALGHIHRRQVISEAPPVVYAGSLARVDFGEEADAKGFYVIEIDASKPPGARATEVDFQEVPGRDFITIRVELSTEDADPTQVVFNAVARHGAALEGAIVRLQVSQPAALEGEIDDARIRAALKPAQHFSIAREVPREARARLGDAAAAEYTPLEALGHYLDTRGDVSPERKKTLLGSAAELIRDKEAR